MAVAPQAHGSRHLAAGMPSRAARRPTMLLATFSQLLNQPPTPFLIEQLNALTRTPSRNTVYELSESARPA